MKRAALLLALTACGHSPHWLPFEGEAPQEDIPPEVLFAALEPELLDRCGGCHEQGSVSQAPFLGAPETGHPKPYDAIREWPRVIVDDPATSVMLTWPASGLHLNGRTPPELEEKLRDWLAAEARAIVREPHPLLGPFELKVPGFNAVAFDPLGEDYAGMAITFEARALDDSGVLSLREIVVHARHDAGVSIRHPLFTLYPADDGEPVPDIVDSFSGLVQKVKPGESLPLGPGTLMLVDWTPESALSIAFGAIEVID